MRTAGAGRLDRRGEFLALALILAGGAVLRLLLLPLPPLKDDMEILAGWGVTIRDLPLSQFYSHSDPECDYPAVYLYFLWATMRLQALASGPVVDVARLSMWLKLAPVAADLAIGLAVYLLCRRFLGPTRALMAAALVVFNPGIAFVSAVWGQVDSIPNAFAMGALVALIVGSPTLAVALAGMGLLVKPQYLLFLLGPAVAYLRSETLRLPPLRSPGGGMAWLRWLARRVLLPLVVLVVVLELLMLPFSVSLWPMPNVEWTFWDRLGLRAGKFALTSVGAFNLWATPIAGTWRPDSTAGWLSLSYQSWGMLLAGVAMIPSLVLAWRRPDNPTAVIWSGFIIYMAFFVLTTRIHERYLFTAIPLVAAASVFALRFVPYYLAISGLYFANLWVIFNTQPSGPGRLEASQYAGLVSALSVSSVVVLLAAVVVVPYVMGACPSWRSLPLWENNGSGWLPDPVGAVVWLRRQAGRRPRIAIPLVALLLVLSFAAGFAGGRSAAVADQGVHGVMVRAYRPWQDSGVRVVEGQRLFISARGDWTNKRGGERFGPGGGRRLDEGTVMPQVPIGVLVARVAGSAPFVVGESTRITAPGTGPLEFIMNDWLVDRADAQGTVNVKVVFLDP